MSSHFPKWTCKNGCKISLEPDCKEDRCPNPGCNGQLVRWRQYEVKQKGRAYPPRHKPRPVA